MTQRIFDVDNPQDVKDLFNLLPDKVRKIRWASTSSIFFDDKNNIVTSCDFICIAWRDKTEIIRPVDELQLVGKLCWFWDEIPEIRALGVLKAILTKCKCPYRTQDNTEWEHCCPVRRNEVQFVEDEK